MTCEPTAVGADLTAHTTALRCLGVRTTALRVIVQPVLAGLQQGNPILVVLHSHCNITPARESIRRAVCIARESVPFVIDQTVQLAHQNGSK